MNPCSTPSLRFSYHSTKSSHAYSTRAALKDGSAGSTATIAVRRPQAAVFQVHEQAASQQLKETRALHAQLKDHGFRLAIEGFGSGRDTEVLLNHLKPEFIKIDGTLMQGLTTASEKQDRVKQLVQLAKGSNATTIAERVEDANTMAALWQLGVEYIQGYFVNAPEAVVLG